MPCTLSLGISFQNELFARPECCLGHVSESGNHFSFPLLQIRCSVAQLLILSSMLFRTERIQPPLDSRHLELCVDVPGPQSGNPDVAEIRHKRVLCSIADSSFRAIPRVMRLMLLNARTSIFKRTCSCTPAPMVLCAYQVSLRPHLSQSREDTFHPS